MLRCLHCRCEVPLGTGICPECGSDLPAGSEAGWVTVAQLGNLAEAGFFADYLAEQEIDVRLQQQDRFSAVDGGWDSDYFIQAPEGDAHRAARLIQQQLQSDGEEEGSEAYDPLGYPVLEESGASLFPWKPLVVVALAGGMAFWMSQGGLVALRGDPPPRRGEPLWRVLEQLEHPLTSPSAPGQPQRRLHYDSQQELLYLDEDHDGDGFYEHRRRFRYGRELAQEAAVH